MSRRRTKKEEETHQKRLSPFLVYVCMGEATFHSQFQCLFIFISYYLSSLIDKKRNAFEFQSLDLRRRNYRHLAGKKNTYDSWQTQKCAAFRISSYFLPWNMAYKFIQTKKRKKKDAAKEENTREIIEIRIATRQTNRKQREKYSTMWTRIIEELWIAKAHHTANIHSTSRTHAEEYCCAVYVHCSTRWWWWN